MFPEKDTLYRQQVRDRGFHGLPDLEGLSEAALQRRRALGLREGVNSSALISQHHKLMILEEVKGNSSLNGANV
jgi:hypothetical protein